MKATQSFEYKNVSKIKLKKNAFEEVDVEKEWRKDPKYKTELCKSFEAKGICVYGNKCRFFHELVLTFRRFTQLRTSELVIFC